MTRGGAVAAGAVLVALLILLSVAVLEGARRAGVGPGDVLVPCRISGRVLYLDGRNATGIPVLVKNRTAVTLATATSDGAGNFSLAFGAAGDCPAVWVAVAPPFEGADAIATWANRTAQVRLYVVGMA